MATSPALEAGHLRGFESPIPDQILRGSSMVELLAWNQWTWVRFPAFQPYGLLTQLGECYSYKVEVVGPSPTETTNIAE